MATPRLEYSARSGESACRTSGSSIARVTSAFLAPPEVAERERYVPTKAASSDHIILSMKKRHHPEHNDHARERTSVPVGINDFDMDSRDCTEHSNLVRSKSLPWFLSPNVSAPKNKPSSPVVSTDSKGSLRIRQRSLTLPSKATSTRGVSTVSSLCKQHKRTRKNKSRTSPAIITLRRATNHSSSDTGMTFFPPPKFNRTRSSFMTYFISTLLGDGEEHGVNYREHGTGDDPRREGSMQTLLRSTAGTTSDVAGPAITEVVVESMAHSVVPDSVLFRRRRCSTKYTTRSSVYEVVWDENDTPTDGSGVSARSSTTADSSSRRQSVAVDRLETQLCKALQQSRRASEALAEADARESAQLKNGRWSLSKMLTIAFSRLANEAALRELPRSKASRISGPPTSASSAAAAQLQDTSHAEFSAVNWTEPFLPNPSCGTRSGSCNGTENISVQGSKVRPDSSLKESSRTISSLGKQPVYAACGRRAMNDEMMPLLQAP